jgi:hypothetical protein
MTDLHESSQRKPYLLRWWMIMKEQKPKFNDHPEDQFPNLLRRRSSRDAPPDLGDQLPVQTESGPVPTHHRFERDHNEGMLPCGPKSTNGDPEELVEQL